MKGDLKEALIHYKKALNTDESSVVALAGIILCQILEGRLAEAEQQLEFLAEVKLIDIYVLGKFIERWVITLLLIS